MDTYIPIIKKKSLKEINFFELQYSFISDFLTNPKTVELYSKGQIESPTIEAVTEFFIQFIDNNNAYWVKRNANIEAEKQNKQNYEFKGHFSSFTWSHMNSFPPIIHLLGNV